MPPVNSPSNLPPPSSPPPISSSSSLQQLSAVSIPIPPDDDQVHDDNVNFLRSRVRSPPDSSASASSSSLSRQRRRRQQILSEFDSDPMDLEDSTGRRSSIEINRRIPIVRRQRDSPNNATTNNHSSMPNYEGRVANHRSLYGWAPASEDDVDGDDDDLTYEPLQDSSSISSWFGRLSDRNNESSRRHVRHGPIRRTPPPPLPDNPHESSNSHRFNEYPLSTTEALLQSVRRQPRVSRTRTLQNYLLDQDRATHDAEEGRDRSGATPTSHAYRFVPSSRGESTRPLTYSDLRARINAHRQLHMENPPSPRLKETIKYLDRLRYSRSFAESLTSAAAGGFAQLESLTWDHEDFILETSSIPPPPMCSWLRPGVVLSGSQRATASGTSFGLIFGQRSLSPPRPQPQSLASPSSSHDARVVNGSEQNSTRTRNRINVYASHGRPYESNNVYNLAANKDENWPVKVTIHDINTQDMTLSGTMEAYNIPDKTSQSPDAHIVTFLEGEIIDFNTHTLETKNFKADAEIDSTYWRELQPFKNMTDEEMTRNLVSRKWITEKLFGGWILMRWKERCFISPTENRQGLTISGFYYISLDRASGHIEGLYYDPGSSPYQQLSLQPEAKKMVRPSYTFR